MQSVLSCWTSTREVKHQVYTFVVCSIMSSEVDRVIIRRTIKFVAIVERIVREKLTVMCVVMELVRYHMKF